MFYIDFQKQMKLQKLLHGLFQRISKYFRSVPSDIRNILINFSKDENNALAVTNAISINFDKIPAKNRNILLSNLSKRPSCYINLLFLIINNLDNIPKKLHKIF